MNGVSDGTARPTERRRIFLRDFALDCRIGVHDFEQGRTQRVLINVDLYLAPPKAPAGDRLADVLDYDFVRREIAALVSGRHIKLQETLAEEIVALCLARAEVEGVRVSTEKLDVYPDCRSVGVEIVRFRSARS
ncbi:MAG: dihydroneopterin aldolase [Alphaproteobacteria bacterium]|nr:dihydroneopterin aldolase [Alphaproteobacteria bacterium]